MDISTYVNNYMSGIHRTWQEFPVESMVRVVEAIYEGYRKNKKIITMGNGGHAATASHVVADMVKHPFVSDARDEIVFKGKRFKALCLSDSPATITTWANDLSFEDIFSEQLENWVERGDVVIAFTGAGNSENLLRAFKVAKEKGAVTIALTGSKGGKIKELADICCMVPSDDHSFIEDMHLGMSHIWCNYIRGRIQGKF